MTNQPGTGNFGTAPQAGTGGHRRRAAEIDIDEARKAFFLMVGFIVLIWFLHVSWNHIEGNSGPLFVFGLLAAYRGVVKFLGVTLLVAITSGLAVWLFQSGNELTVGASGLIFGYFGYVLARGLIDRNLIDALAAVVMGLSYAYILTVAIPGTPGVSWIDHLGGLVGGLASGWIFRTRRGLQVRSRTKPPAAPATRTGQELQVGQDHPRADLHKELGDLGL
jgi:membrane associated rhomboid family serine protease